VSLEAAILASSMSPPQYWEKYPNLINVEPTINIATAGTYQTVLSVNAPGYVTEVLAYGAEYQQLRITIDGVVTEFIETGSYSIMQGIVNNSSISAGTSTAQYCRAPSSTNTFDISGSYFIPWTQYGTQITSSNSNSTYLFLPAPIQFKNSLLVEASVHTMTGYANVGVRVLGGHA
jgi:hypothetical protein